ncbi:MAG TPA: kelch repeat-containing protein [Candidatus Limnocylindria bacterium]|nr:kelch repeat-containing protein [Candidatus Limnocylindria bacterium]
MRPLALAVALLIACQPSPGASTPTAPVQGAPATQGATATPVAGASGAPVATGWKRIADIPTPRSEVAVATSRQTKVYVIGGFGGPERVERFDAETARWERVADLPIRVDHPMAVAVEGLQNSSPQGVFVFGGYVGGSATARSFRLDVDAGRWEEIAPMPGPRAAAAAAATIGGMVYVVGGAEGGRLVAPTYEYNVNTRQWRSVAPIPTPRDHLAAVALSGKICAIGGRRLSMSLNLASLECYDPRSDMWERRPDAPTARGGLAAAVHGFRMYVVGGEQPSGTYREVEIFDDPTNTWSRGPDLPTPRHGLGAVVIPQSKTIAGGNVVFTSPRLLVLTGGPTPGGSQTAVCEALDLN